MARLIIRNIGPIKDVDIELNKVNVFIGEQSSGKSTIAKFVSFFSKHSVIWARMWRMPIIGHRMNQYLIQDGNQPI